ncbi:MAG: type V CRISPR-associated endonuclease Cas1 [Clostridia bacterium]|nr:type V CRISPR-associated endonuclease Cas1 [Clostridia bacterium]
MNYFAVFRFLKEMLNLFTAPDFSKKQIVFVMFNEGEKLSFSNDNLVVKDADGKIKFQCTCYRLFVVFAIGHTSITSVLIQKAQKFGFFIALMTAGFRLYSVIGAAKDGNTLLRRKQYQYEGLGIAKIIIANKMNNQCNELKNIRNKNEYVKEAIFLINQYIHKIDSASALNELMAYEGLASKLFFKNHFSNISWNGRQPRIKRDYINSTMDVGYTLLFTYIDALLSSYGFDTYCGVMHRQFYMRKSLVCDIVEPFRIIIDHEIKKAINLKQIREEDFVEFNGQYRLKWSESSRYVKILMSPLIEHKEEIFDYVQSFYRAFMKELPVYKYPIFDWGE